MLSSLLVGLAAPVRSVILMMIVIVMITMKVMRLMVSLIVVVVDDVVDQNGVLLLLRLVRIADAVAIQVVAMRLPGSYEQLFTYIRMRFQLLHCKARTELAQIDLYYQSLTYTQSPRDCSAP